MVESKCNSCEFRHRCPMPKMLKSWALVKYEYQHHMPDYIYDEFYTEEPEVKDGDCVWCPEYIQMKKGE